MNTLKTLITVGIMGVAMSMPAMAHGHGGWHGDGWHGGGHHGWYGGGGWHGYSRGGIIVNPAPVYSYNPYGYPGYYRYGYYRNYPYYRTHGVIIRGHHHYHHW